MPWMHYYGISDQVMISWLHPEVDWLINLWFYNGVSFSVYWYCLIEEGRHELFTLLVYTRKHRHISHIFLLKIFVSNQGCGLSARTSGHHAVNLHKLPLLKELLTSLTLPFLSMQVKVTQVGISIPPQSCLQCWRWLQKSIHHERENTMLFSSILVLNGRPFPRCSIVWRQICWIDYQTHFEELISENKSTFALYLFCFQYSIFDQMPGY